MGEFRYRGDKSGGRGKGGSKVVILTKIVTSFRSVKYRQILWGGGRDRGPASLENYKSL